jgi:hypothetical protein
VADACCSCFPLFNAAILLTQDPIYPLLQAYFQLNRGGGVPQNALFNQAYQIQPAFSLDQYQQAFRQSLKQNVFVNIVPPVINYFAPPPPTSYIISPNLDQNHKNSNYTKFLLSLVGGYSSPLFAQWFVANVGCCNTNTNCNDPCFSAVAQILR